MSDGWKRVGFKAEHDEDNPYGPIPAFVDAVLDAVGPDVIAGSRNRLRALGCVLLGSVAVFVEDRVLKVPNRDLRRYAVGTLGKAARLPGDDVQSLVVFCQYAVEPPVRKTEADIAALVAKYPDLEDDIRRDADTIAGHLDLAETPHEVWEQAYGIGKAEFTDWWEDADLFNAKRLVKVVRSAPAD